MRGDERAAELARAFRQAIMMLQRDGLKCSPIMLSAHFINGEDQGLGWAYSFMWLDIGSHVRGFFVRADNGQDIELYPAIHNQAQVEGTGWRVQVGAVVTRDEDVCGLAGEEKAAVVRMDEHLLAEGKLSVGLVLSDGQKSSPVKAKFFRKVASGGVAPLRASMRTGIAGEDTAPQTGSVPQE